MAYYPDFARCDYFGKWEDALVAIGWHEAGRPFVTGHVDKVFFDALAHLLVEPWQPAAVAGRQPCGMCRFTGGPSQMHVNGEVISLGGNSLFVPGGDKIFVAPSLIAHYVDAHGYQPPAEFQRAVLSCPAMRSVEYLKSMRSRGLGSRSVTQ